MDSFTVFYIAVLIFSIVLHEIAHGYVANLLGDPTAKMQGRLTLNPLKHIDPLGSVILPAFMILSGSKFLFGWAKPVPYNPYNLKKGGRFAEALVAFAGPAVNLLLALLVALLYKSNIISSSVAFMVAYMNIFLAILNLLPFPPLDGSKVLPSLLPAFLRVKLEYIMKSFENAGFLTLALLIAFLLIFASKPLFYAANFLTILILGF